MFSRDRQHLRVLGVKGSCVALTPTYDMLHCKHLLRLFTEGISLFEKCILNVTPFQENRHLMRLCYPDQ